MWVDFNADLYFLYPKSCGVIKKEKEKPKWKIHNLCEMIIQHITFK